MDQPTSELNTICESNLNTGIVHKERKVIFDSNYWHKIVVKNAQHYERDFVLQTIMQVLHPMDFIPICYTVNVDSVSFLLKNCGAAITELCRLNLTVPHPDPNKGAPAFKFSIQLQYAHAKDLNIEIQANIVQVLKKRYNNVQKVLNLEAFYKDPDLIEFCPLSQTKLMYFVFHLSKEFKVETLKLGSNDLELLKPLETLSSSSPWKGLASIDLRKNKIRTIDQLLVLKLFPITELILDENPICEKLFEHDYIKMVKNYCPKILKLDGLPVPNLGLLSFRRNYLCDPSGQDVVDQFLEHYFSLYDSDNRSQLQGLYHDQALFTITSQYLCGQSTSAKTRLADYKKLSRNIKHIVNYSKSLEFLYIGSNIIKILMILPKCEHDPYTFTVDLMYFTQTLVIFTVTGVFREINNNLLGTDYTFGFARTFVLRYGDNQEFNIVNEQLHVSNATTSQESRAFKTIKVHKPLHLYVPSPRSTIDRNQMVNGLVKITNLKPKWAEKCLMECNYDMKSALNLFVDLYKREQLPLFAFRSENESRNKKPCCVHYQNYMKNQKSSQMIMNKSASVQSSQPAIKTADTKNAKTGQDKPPLRINDKVLMNALSIPPTTPLYEATKKLKEAADRILVQYTLATKYYRALAKEYYRFNLLTEAREFLDEAMKRLTKPLSEEVYSSFALFEVQFGDLSHAEEMIKTTAENYDIQKTVRFIGEHVAKINIVFARRMFKKTIMMNISEEKTQALLVAFKDFELKYGNVETLNFANNFTPVLENGELEDSADEAPIYQDNMLITLNESQLHTFELFRTSLLRYLKLVCNPQKVDDKIAGFVNRKDENVAAIAIDILREYLNDSDVCWFICDHLWKQEKFTKHVFEFLDKSVNVMNHRTSAFYKARLDIRERNFKRAYQTVLTHVKASSKNIVTMFENLMWNEPEFAKFAFENALNDLKSSDKYKVLIMQFSTYAKFFGTKETLSKADRSFQKVTSEILFFHPDVVLQDETCREYRKEYESLLKGQYTMGNMLRFVTTHWNNFCAMVEGTRALYYHGYIQRAQEIKNNCLKTLKSENKMRYQLSVAFFEMLYGSMNGLKLLNKIDKSFKANYDYKCVNITGLINVHRIDEAITLLNVLLHNDTEFMDPRIQQGLFCYYMSWIDEMKADIYDLGFHKAKC